MHTLKGRVALVTAAGQGIGRAIADRLATDGAHVVACDRSAASLSGLGNVEPYVLDVTDEPAVRAAADKFRDVDILINGVGYVHSGTILECSTSDWQTSFRTNVDSMYYTIRSFIPRMLNRQFGVIVNISSVASSIKGVANRFAYGATKAAVIGLTKSVAADFVGQGIRCNAICPGTVESPSLEERLRATGDYEGALKAFRARQPMGRLGRPEEVAALAAYLASDDGAFTTGQAYVIDGGWTN